jgi:hypothetical protein
VRLTKALQRRRIEDRMQRRRFELEAERTVDRRLLQEVIAE